MSTDKRSGIANDPDSADGPKTAACGLGQAISVSVVVKGLPLPEE